MEFLFVRFTEYGALALVRGLKKLKRGRVIDFGHGLVGMFEGREGEMACVSFDMKENGLTDWLEHHGHIPLPPYIIRPDVEADRERYQTVYAAKKGSCAAPTAGLHFSPELLEEIAGRGVQIHRICLHVGPGTFRPFTGDDITSYRPDAEYAEVPEETWRALVDTKERGGKVIAVGTTTTRALETAAMKGGGFNGSADLFIYPGFKFRMVDGLVTNFHLPRSSLMALVCALAGREKTLDAYRDAISHGYRFYSYGDAMLVL